MSLLHHRRTLLGAAASLAFPALLTPAVAQARLRPTPAQAEGPFYPLQLPADSDADLLRNGTRGPARGQAAWLEGTVVDLDGRPLAGAQVEIWQCDADGHYHHPGDGDRADPDFQGFGRVSVDRAGAWRFRTLMPVPYAGRTPHIHVKLKLGVHELLTTQVYVAGEPRNERDGLWRRLRDPRDRDALTLAFTPGADGLPRARFPIVAAA